MKFLKDVSNKKLSAQAEAITLAEYNPVSIYNVPVTNITKAKYPVVDMHSHDYPTTEAELDQWVATMDASNIRKTIVLSGYIGTEFDELVSRYSKYSDRFELWCGLDLTKYGTDDFIPTLVAELERCHSLGAKGIGELTDKGDGVYLAFQDQYMAKGLHLNSPLMDQVYSKCKDLNMPLSIHVSEPYWFYLDIDASNDGLMNAEYWHIDTSVPDRHNYQQLLAEFGEAVSKNPETMFIACHYMNANHDLDTLGSYFDLYPNLYADISARFGETGSIPRYMKEFYTKYADRLLYGTDNGTGSLMYQITFRFLETADEHFYYPSLLYHWNYSAYDISDDVLKKVYYENAERVFGE